MSNFIEQLVEASKRHGVPCVVIGGGSEDYEPEHDIVPATAVVPDPEGDADELGKLRRQVQTLTTQLAEEASLRAATVTVSDAPPINGAAATVAAGDHGSSDDYNIDVLGLDDEKLARKLLRLGYDTVGKLREAHSNGKCAEAKIKKDWLIEIGMKLAGASPSAPSSAVAVSGESFDSGVPAGHADRTWPERLSLARVKQTNLNELRGALDAKRGEAAVFTKKGEEIPEELDDDVIKLEDDIALVEAQVVAMRWCMGLDPDRNVSLDEALDRANLGPWKESPTPRVAPEPAPV